MTPLTGAPSPHVEALGWTLLHSLWQQALVAGVLLALKGLLARRSAEARYSAASLGLALMVLLPVLTFARLERSAPAGTSAPQAFVGPVAVPLPPDAAPGGGDAGLRGRLAAILPGLVVGWAVGVALLSLRLVFGWAGAERLLRSGRAEGLEAWQRRVEELASKLALRRPIRVLRSLLVEVPTVVGWLRPVILLPVATLSGLAPIQVETLLAHELAHVRRHDYLANLLQLAVETLFFHHPAVWWVSHRMRVERELCCDDAAVALCGDAVGYARALAEMEGLRGGDAAPALGASSGSLLERVRRLVARPEAHGSAGSRTPGSLLAVAVALTLVSLASWGAQPRDPALPHGPRPEARRLAPASPAPQAAALAVPAEPAEPVSGEEPAETAADVAEEGPEAPSALDEEKLSHEELEAHGVTREYAEDLSEAGLGALTPATLLQLRSQGVDGDFVRGLKALGYERLSPAELVDLRRHGVSPEFAEEMGRLGERPSLSRLIFMRSVGITPDYVEELQAEGYAHLSPVRLSALRSHGITADYIRELKDLGYDHLSVSQLIALRSHGVTPEFVQELRDLGFEHLSLGLLVSLKDHGVPPDYIRSVEESGFVNPGAEGLIELRSQGVDPSLPAGTNCPKTRGAAE